MLGPLLSCLSLLVLPPGGTHGDTAPGIALPHQGTLIFLGDSITGQHLFTAYVETYLRRAFPDRALRVVNRGVRGDTVADALTRLARDVTPLDPARVFVMFGVNDGGYGAPSGIRLARYRRDLERLVAELRARTRATVVLLTPTCVAPVDASHQAYNEMLAHMSESVLDLGRRLQVTTIDTHSPFCARLQSGEPSLMADALHPGPAGHGILAAVIARSWPVSEARLEHAVDPCAQAQGAAFTITHDHRNVSLPPETRIQLTHHWLVVPGAACDLELLVEGRSVARLSGESLRRGVDLDGLSGTPWASEAQRAYELVQERWRWSYALWDPEGLGVDAITQVGGVFAGSATALARQARAEEARIDLELASLRHGPVAYAARLVPVAKHNGRQTD